MPDIRCILPWVHQHADISGHYSLCCFNIYHEGFHGFGKGQAPLEAFNHPEMKKARLQMLRGEEPESCKVCYHWERSGVLSNRINKNKEYKDYTYLYDKTEADGHLDSVPIYIDFRFGNLCNFTCRMCSAHSSSSWVKESKHHGFSRKDYPTFTDEWTNNTKFWSDIDKIKGGIREIYFAGGEPLVQEGHYKLLQYLIDNKCTDIILSYNTNLSYSGKFKGHDIKEMWKYFKRINLSPSIEGFKEKAEYGRKGLSWDTFERNVDNFDEYINNFSITTSIYSITSNINLVEWITARNKPFHITNLNQPKFLSTCVFPKNIKQQIIKDYRKLLSNKKFFYIVGEEHLTTLLGSLKNMNSKDYSHLQKDFKQYNEKLDLYRNESFEATFPELAEWYRSI